ncbi:GMC family oxidoreductase [Rhodococcus sp. NPDC058521]|uniref:GMC family oxidoreductase n=1 Tax=Rhodococcus sp. NPDC058521 TaxID=3346536 RepID=UPI00364D71D1
MSKQNLVDEADYVVAGAGSAGCAVAARLAESGASVVLLEAGGSDDKILYKLPGLIAPMHAVPQIEKLADWGYHTTPQKHALDRKIPQTRGKVLGGSSSVNGMLWVRGNRANYDDWVAEGNKGWGADDVNDVYRRMEDFEDGGNEFRGAGGPIKVTRNANPTEASQQFQDAAADTLGVRVLEDYNAESQEGFSTFQQNTSDGLRYSSSRAYLHNGSHPTLSVQTGVTVARIVIEGGRATGVEVIDKSGRRRTIRAHSEVIVSAGVFGSPQLLMLSGVGHADHLAEKGITTVMDLPVGDNLHDHLFVPTSWSMPNATHRGTPGYFARGMAKQFTRGGSFLENSVFEAVGFVRTSLAADVPDLQIHVLPWGYPSPNQDAPTFHGVDPFPCLTVMSTLIYPRSRGTVRLATNDPTKAPLIDFNYLAESGDRQVLREGVEMIREIMGNAKIAPSSKGEVHPGAEHTGADLDREILNRATTVYHGVGSCRMGVDENAVVDPELRVRGIDGLRVADASIMPTITGGNTNAPSIMIGEKCAELILG